MPELPEVETVRRSLLALEGQTLLKIDIPDGRLRYRATPKQFEAFIGQKLSRIERHGKYLVFVFSKGPVVFHLGMTGRMLIGAEKSPYVKLMFYFDKDRLDFIDVRRFGFVLSNDRALKALPPGAD